MANFISFIGSTETRKLNIFIMSIIYGIAWIVFHFTIIFFFGLVLKSIMLVGFYLGFGALIGMFSDVPIGVMQKYYEPKKILVFGTWMMLLSALIFMKFIYFSSLDSLVPDIMNTTNQAINSTASFFDSTINRILIVFVAFLYGVTKETLDVTYLSYILNSSDPSEYAESISKYNIGFGIGALIGMVSAGLILGLSIKVAIVIVIIMIFVFQYFIKRFFKLGDEAFNVKEIRDFKITSIKNNLDGIKKLTIQKVKIENLKKSISNIKYIFLKPLEIRKEIDFGEIKKQTKDSLESFKAVITKKPRSVLLIWVLTIMLYFGFWDTFVATFQVDFLNKIIMRNGGSDIVISFRGLMTGYLLLGILIAPIYLSQQYFIKRSKKDGIFNIIVFGLLLSSVSLILFGLSQNIFYVIIFGLLNSFGYAAAMPLAIATFSEKYNTEYAKRYNLKEIDSNASAAPYKMLMNMANIVALVLGGILVALMGFNSFFIFVGSNLLMLFIYSLIHKEDIIKDNL